MCLNIELEDKKYVIVCLASRNSHHDIRKRSLVKTWVCLYLSVFVQAFSHPGPKWADQLGPGWYCLTHWSARRTQKVTEGDSPGLIIAMPHLPCATSFSVFYQLWSLEASGMKAHKWGNSVLIRNVSWTLKLALCPFQSEEDKQLQEELTMLVERLQVWYQLCNQLLTVQWFMKQLYSATALCHTGFSLVNILYCFLVARCSFVLNV